MPRVMPVMHSLISCLIDTKHTKFKYNRFKLIMRIECSLLSVNKNVIIWLDNFLIFHISTSCRIYLVWGVQKMWLRSLFMHLMSVHITKVYTFILLVTGRLKGREPSVFFQLKKGIFHIFGNNITSAFRTNF